MEKSFDTHEAARHASCGGFSKPRALAIAFAAGLALGAAGMWGMSPRGPWLIPEGAALVGNASSRIVHRLDCRHAVRLAPAHRYYFRNAEEAKSTGFRPCKQCAPLGWADLDTPLK